MDKMSPTLGFVYQLEAAYRRYQDWRTAVLAANDLRRGTSGGDSLITDVMRLISALDRRESAAGIIDRMESPYRRGLFLILCDGFNGQPVLARLEELRRDLEEQAELDIEAHIDRLPLIMLMPLLLLQFPAFMLLLLGPISSQFLEALR